jgi:hypothetical protein
MSTIYAVTSGSYSDYSVNAVFSTREMAEEFVNGDRGYDIEEWELDTPRDNWTIVSVWMDKEGNVIGTPMVQAHNTDTAGFRFFGSDIISPNPSFLYAVATDSIERAVKVCNEKRAQILAANLWGNNAGVRELFGVKA